MPREDDQHAPADSPSSERFEETLSPEELSARSAETLASDSVKTDVRLASDPTALAPSFPEPAKHEQPLPSGVAALDPGERLDDFEIIKMLGRGAFGVVYLARQLSLDRRVALKVTVNEGSEGRTMARLEHDHVVQVFSETVDPTGRTRLLCMQLVPGAGLDELVKDLHRRKKERGEWTGADYLAIVESRSQAEDVLNSSALRDREAIAGFDAVQATAWVGARLAEAVDYAHKQGVLHRDIKPANVLVNQYGRPMLADFNIAFRSFDSGTSPDDTFGGTLAFMAPEHLDAFSPRSEATAADVDEQSDIYSLGIVIFEVLMGDRPFDDPRRRTSRTEFIEELRHSRRAAAPPLEAGPPNARKTLRHTLAKSLNAEKPGRFESGAQFAAALEGCRELRAAELALPKEGRITRSAWKRPFLWILLFALGPQAIGSAVNIAYNSIETIQNLSEEQQAAFARIVLPYNLVVYPLALAGGAAVLWPFFRAWRHLEGCERLEPDFAAKTRRQAISLPLWLLLLAGAGWLPGGLIFPAAINAMTGDVPAAVFFHFLASFTLSGLIAAAYSFCGLQYLSLRVLYPRIWTDASRFHRIAQVELAGTPWRLRLIEYLAVAIPPVTAALCLVVLILSPTLDANDKRFIALAVALILLGAVGYQVVSAATRSMAKSYAAFTGRQR